MTSTHERPHPPRRMPRVLPTPPHTVPANQFLEPKATLCRIVYDEVLFALIHSGRDELSAVAIALSVSRKVVARAGQRCEQ